MRDTVYEDEGVEKKKDAKNHDGDDDEEEEDLTDAIGERLFDVIGREAARDVMSRWHLGVRSLAIPPQHRPTRQLSRTGA